MKRTLVAKSIAVMMAAGLAVPGCFLFRNDDKPESRFCASPVEGERYCVDSSFGPAAAWNDAKAAGNEPIQMWVEWPDNIELKELVTRADLLNAWLNDIRVVIDYVRVTQNNAESYHASLSGKLGDKLRQARQAQEQIIAAKSADPKAVIEKLLLDKAVNETDPLKAEIAGDKQTIADLLAVVDQAKVDGAPFAAQYKVLVDDFTAYRATESIEITAYTMLATSASNATLAELDAFNTSILDTAHAASAKPNALLVPVMKLSAQILQFENTSREAIAPHSDFMSTYGATIPDMSSGALRSIVAMLGYTQQRVARSDATAKELLLGVGMRRQALQLLANAPSPARATIANVLLANASTKFADITRVRTDVMAAISMNSQLGLPYLAKRYDDFAALLQMVPMCNAVSASWRETGCVAMRPKFKDATKYLKVTLPAEISQGLTVMKTKGVDPAIIQKVQQKLNAGDIKGAALAHDVLLNSLEGT
jgi:hypothetical protein